MNFPTTVLSQHIAILGKTGSGKTYTAKGLVEGLLEEQRRVCVIDPTGAWWGLRSSADGASAGFPVVILGGSHGDTGLPGESGAACAQLLAENSLQVIFDTSLMGVNERTRWFAAFGHELFRRNTRPLHLVIDEAHMFAPQGKVPDPDTGKMLHAANTLASGGRSRGIRLMMITQRPAKLHKDSLTCCDTLVAMRVIAPQDRQAIEEWVSGNGDKDQAKKVLTSLASLPKGEGWVWAPEIGFLERLKFPKIRTFDSSKTPEDGDEAPAPKTIAEIDLSAITATMTAAVEEAKANNPKVLRARIKELEERLEGPRSDANLVDAGRVAQIEAERAGHLKSIAKLHQDLKAARKEAEYWSNIYAELWSALQQWQNEARQRLRLLSLDTDTTPEDFVLPSGPSGSSFDDLTHSEISSRHPKFESNGTHHALERGASRREAMPVGDSAGRQTPTYGRDETSPIDERRAPAARAHTRQPPGESAPGEAATDTQTRASLTGPQRRVIDAIAWWVALGVTPTRVQVAHIAGYSPSGGSWRNYLSECRSLNLIRDVDGDRLDHTEGGNLTAEWPAEAPSLQDLHARLKSQLSGPQKKIFDVLVGHGGGKRMSRTEVAELAGYTATGGSFRNTCSELSSLGLVTYPNKTSIQAAAWVMGVKS